MKALLMFALAIGASIPASSFGHKIAIPNYLVHCKETSLTSNFKLVSRGSSASGIDTLVVQDMLINRVMSEKHYALSIGGLDMNGNRVLIGEEIAFNTGLVHERAILTMAVGSEPRLGLLRIFEVRGDEVTKLLSETPLICD